MATRPRRTTGADATVGNKVLRMLALLTMLPRSPSRKSTSELHLALSNEGHKVDIRTVERYLFELSTAPVFRGVVLCDDRSKPYGWSIAPDRELLPSALNPSMAVTWDLVGRYLHSLLPPSARNNLEPAISHARQWLRDATRPGVTPWSKKVAYIPRGMPLLPAKVPRGVLEAVHNALHDGLQLKVSYEGKDEPFILHPRALVDRGVVGYIFASAWDYTDFRLYALHRMKRAEVLSEPVNKLPFSLRDKLDEGVLELPQGPQVRVKLRFYNRAGNHLSETPMATDQTFRRIDHENSEVEATVRDTEELRWWIQGLGANVEVLAPKSLRDKVANELKQAARRYR